MRTLDVGEAAGRLDEVVEWVDAGDEVVLTRDGRPVAKVVPFLPAMGPRAGGRWRGKVWIAADFDATPVDVIEAFFEDLP
jgi:prevent-host-death family protein